MDCYVARQPIFDASREVFGYELLFRSGPDNFFDPNQDGDEASNRLMSDSMSVHGLDTLAGGRKAFFNITRRVLVEESFTVLPPEQTVVELLETIEPDDEVIAACGRLRDQGYCLALDDFIFEPGYERLLSLIEILKVDFAGSTPEQRETFARHRDKYQFDLLAEKVETHEEFDEAAKLGYALFQGYFFCKPQIVTTKDVPGCKINTLRFLEQINQPELNLDGLEAIIREDVALSYKLLRYLNSASFGLRNRVNSIKHAMMLLGATSLRKWATLIAMASLGDDKPHELVALSLCRARLSELVGAAAGMAAQANDLFLLGMFSLIDAMVDRPMGELLDGMPIADDVKATLLGDETKMRPIHNLMVALERGRWSDVHTATAALGIDGEDVMGHYRTAIQWAASVGSQHSDGGYAKAS